MSVNQDLSITRSHFYVENLVATITHYAYQPTARGLKMPGVVKIIVSASLGKAIEDILLFVECGVKGEKDKFYIFLLSEL